jgi:predicted nucleotidyltransferase
MKVRTRDFIHTTDDLFFAVTNYLHPNNRIIAFLRYIPDNNGNRIKNGKKYSKVSSDEAYAYLNKNHPEYLYFCDVTNIEMMGVPLDKIKEILKPEDRLKEITKLVKENRIIKEDKIVKENNIKSDNISDLYKNLIDLADFFHYIADIPYENLGISGSTLPHLEKNDTSDLDFVVYGLKNHRKAINAFKKHKDKEVTIPEIKKKITLNSIENSYWDKLYHKRIKDSSLTKKEFYFYENRKNNRGTINGILFDILSTRNWDEITGKWGEIRYENMGFSKIQAKIKNALGSFDNPAIYLISDLKILKGEKWNITELASFTHTYAGQALECEEIIAQGKVEKVIKSMKTGKDIISYRLVVGTTRESINEYIKLKNNIN